MQAYDVIIIGAGHNGLTCAAYLAMAGLKVKVLNAGTSSAARQSRKNFCPAFATPPPPTR